MNKPEAAKMNEQVRKAEECVRQHAQHLRWGIAGDRDTFRWIAEALDAQGLLKTEAEARLVEASLRAGVPETQMEWVRAVEAVRAERAAAVPKPRWTSQPYRDGGDMWFVGGMWSASERPSEVHRAGGFTQQQAEAVAAALNALESGSGGAR